ncbi:hypothetical protein SAMN05446927_8086 [Caballeronia arationis]|jgi:hypothetical protein|uniref:Uncharacterized protein n=1 Tax=Caballeronia arationis TaxID=1777142 RepID=A0A7Z7IFZ5_9BURK|nr:hypothetical protein [Caballeronia arationis]SOE91202.1 hypothetical protein SAMN05446927_8086 [Caballeronia arationis]
MPPPTIDPTDPEALVKELFSDERWAKDQFFEHLSDPLLALCEALAGCFRSMERLKNAAGQINTQRISLVAAFMYGVLDDLVISTKLLLTGKLSAAGNVMRQVVEGIAMSILCSTDDPLIIAWKKKKPIKALYWQKVWNEDQQAQGYLAIDQLNWNADKLGVTDAGVEQLRQAKKRYNAYSHCGTTTITCRVSIEEPGVFHLGGEFDEAKLDLYRAELVSRNALCRLLPGLIQHLTETMTPPGAVVARAVVPAQRADHQEQ